MYVSLTEDGRIGATTSNKKFAEGMTEFTFPDDFDFAKQDEYRIVDGKLIHDPEPPSDDILEHQAAQIRQSQALAAVLIVLSRMIATLSDTEAESVSLFLPEWTVGTTYKEDEIVRYKGNLYRIVKDTTAVDYYLPDSDPSTYKRIGEPNEEGGFKMVDTHEVDLSTAEFEQLRSNNYIIMQTSTIEAQDYILFRQTDAGTFMMTQVQQIISNDGLKDGYGLLILKKL